MRLGVNKQPSDTGIECAEKSKKPGRLLLLYEINSGSLVGSHVHSFVVSFLNTCQALHDFQCPRLAALLTLHDIYSLQRIVLSVSQCPHDTIQLRQGSCITQSFTLRHCWQRAPDPKISLFHENDCENSLSVGFA